jgi:hypothetical protein
VSFSKQERNNFTLNEDAHVPSPEQKQGRSHQLKLNMTNLNPAKVASSEMGFAHLSGTEMPSEGAPTGKFEGTGDQAFDFRKSRLSTNKKVVP